MNLKSDILKQKVETTPHRSLLRATGLADEDFKADKPFIWIANSYTNIVPGHIHLNILTDEVIRWIKDAWWVPFVWWVPAVCDWIAMFAEMRLSLPSRDHIADNIEIMMLSHSFDWWVWVTNCDKITPWMLMAAWRLDLPAIMLTWWPMKSWKKQWWKKGDLISAFEAVWSYKAGNISKQQLHKIECSACPSAWSCAWLFTANSMACMTEALGMSITDCACTLATDELKKKQAYMTWLKIVELIKSNITPRSIMSKEAFIDAMTVDNAIWWSTNVTLHLPVIAKECSVNIWLRDFDNISKTTANICHISPAGPYFMSDVHEMWWIKRVMKNLERLLNTNRNWVSWNFSEILSEIEEIDNDVIRSLKNPYYKEGWVACLVWNIAEESVVKQTSVSEQMLKHTWPAKVYNSEEQMIKWLEDWEIKQWDVIVLPFQWPAWAPWMPEMLTPTAAIKWAWFDRVALITDWRFSWWTAGPCIWHIYPEAINWGNIWLIKNGDIIEIDMPNRYINAKVSDWEFKRRRKKGINAPKRKMSPMLVKFRNHHLESKIKA